MKSWAPRGWTRRRSILRTAGNFARIWSGWYPDGMRPPAPPLELASTNRSPFSQMLGVVGILIAACALPGCQPPTPAQKASEAAREMNMAARWGKMDEAANLIGAKESPEFLKRRSEWHGEVRVVETELAGLDMHDATHATVQVDVQWNFADDPNLRTTRLSQEWSDADGKWVMVDEKRVGGDNGLFGEEVKREDKPRDKHFPTRVIH